MARKHNYTHFFNYHIIPIFDIAWLVNWLVCVCVCGKSSQRGRPQAARKCFFFTPFPTPKNISKKSRRVVLQLKLQDGKFVFFHDNLLLNQNNCNSKLALL